MEFRKFLIAIDKAVPAELDVHLICDNLATHKTRPCATGWPATHGFTCTFTPTGSSWINQVERSFGLLTEQLIRRGVHKGVLAPGARRPQLDQQLGPETVRVDQDGRGHPAIAIETYREDLRRRTLVPAGGGVHRPDIPDEPARKSV